MKTKNICTSLFKRELGDRSKFNSFWQLKLKTDFGQAISEKYSTDYYSVYQSFYSYTSFLKSAIEEIESLKERDLVCFFMDQNIGNGKIQEELLKMLLLKPGAFRACCHVDSCRNSTLTEAAINRNENCFILIQNRIQAEDEPLLTRLLHLKNRYDGKSPLDFFREKRKVKGTFNPALQDENYFINFILQNNVDSLLSAIDSLGDKAKEECLQSKDSYNGSILHAVAKSGSRECLELIIKTMGKDIHKLYYEDSRKMTPACYAAAFGSIELLRIILPLSPFRIEEELLLTSDLEPSSIVDKIIAHDDLCKTQYILNTLKPYADKVEKYYANHPDGIRLILSQYTHSAVNFFLLRDYIAFDKESLFIEEFLRHNDQHALNSFSLYYAINYHLHELGRAQRKIAQL